MTLPPSIVQEHGLSPKPVADLSWTGQISDSKCGASHDRMNTTGTGKLSDRECTLMCIAEGAKYVLVMGEIIYQIENQDFAALPEHAGHIATVSGTLVGDTIRVTGIALPE